MEENEVEEAVEAQVNNSSGENTVDTLTSEVLPPSDDMDPDDEGDEPEAAKGPNKVNAARRVRNKEKLAEKDVKIGQLGEQLAFLQGQIDQMQRSPRVTEQASAPEPDIFTGEDDDFISVKDAKKLAAELKRTQAELANVQQAQGATAQEISAERGRAIDANGAERFDDYMDVVGQWAQTERNDPVMFERILKKIQTVPDPAKYVYRLAGGEKADRSTGTDPNKRAAADAAVKNSKRAKTLTNVPNGGVADGKPDIRSMTDEQYYEWSKTVSDAERKRVINGI